MKKNLILIFSVLFGFSSQSNLAQKGSGNSLRVISSNVRYDTDYDKENAWKHRKDHFNKMIKDYSPDIIGTQEVLYNQLNDIKTGNSEYSFVGVGREDGDKKGEYCAIFFKNDRFELFKTNTFGLNEDPKMIGVKGWDAACERIMTYAILVDKNNNDTIVVFNTHFDHVGKLAREKSVDLLKNISKEVSNGHHLIITGDFNANPQSDIIKSLLDDKFIFE